MENHPISRFNFSFSVLMFKNQFVFFQFQFQGLIYFSFSVFCFAEFFKMVDEGG